MPRLDGLAAAQELRQVAPGTSLMMLTTFSEDEFITPALSLGVSGFVLKSGDPRELIAGVRAALAGPRTSPRR
jgi:DNA-binding NarL/FixJ family response regulator